MGSQPHLPCQSTSGFDPEIPERRSMGDRRQCADRRRGSDRRQARQPDPVLVELEMRIAAALRQKAGSVEEDGSGWDKLIVPLP